MSIELELDKRRRLILAKIVGRVSMREIIAAIDASVSSPDFEPGFDVLSDHRQIEEPLTPDQAYLLTHHLRSLAQRLAGSRWAAIAATPASYGMLRMLSVFAERVPMEMRVFRTPEEAEAWLSSGRGDTDESG